jgi:dTDP-4-amino-4,6-dideoxygalactose transaminase
MVEEKIGPGEQSEHLIAIARERLKFDHCVALRSPVIALALALKCLDLKDGDAVLVSALSPAYYQRVLEEQRLKAVVCDISAGTGVIHADSARQAIEHAGTETTVRAIALHHTLGLLPDIPAIMELGIPLIEDSSAAYGTMLGERHAGSFGALTILGLEERDMLTAGGGALLYANTRRDGSALRNNAGLPPEYTLPDMNAAMAIVQFKETERNMSRLKEIAEYYIRAALRSRHKRFAETSEQTYNNYAFPLILETGMKDVIAYAKKKEIGVENAFERTLAGSGKIERADYPEAYSLSLRTALFPMYPRLGAANTEKVAKLIQTLP